MGKQATVKVPVLHETTHALLLELNGRQAWVQREHCAQNRVHNGELEISVWLAKKLSFGSKGNTFALGELIEAATISGSLKIQPKPNQPQQQAALEKLYPLRYFALFMQMRAGKTKVAIDLICNHAANDHIDRVLWLCPNSATATAQQQWDKWAVFDLPKKIVALETVSGCGHARMAEIEAWFTPRCAIIVDESQMIKNDRAKRSKRLARMLDKAPVKGILSGTPITQNVQDLYNQARALDWRIFGYRNIHQFNRKHLVMSEKYPGLIRNTLNVDYLSDRLQPFVYEWFADDYGSRKTRRSVYVDLSDEQQEYIWRIKDAVLYRLRNHIENRSDIYLLFTALQSVLSGHVSARVMQRVFGHKDLQDIYLPTPKLDYLLRYICALDEQKIIWCTRRHELHSIAARLPECVTVSGEMDAVERHRRIQQFRRSRNGTLVAMVHVAKRAIEMSECNEVIYYGHSFDYESWEQSQWRTLLPNKTEICRYTDMIYNNSLDERIQTAHAKKQNIIQHFLHLLKQNRNQAISEIGKL